ncbi:HD domain-containing phosphohydrolase [Methylobacterium sp. J-068]|uniref:HD domain-containing phosphohydrolase n=1 Tax=Methylobacterium sp. J-068 TaxID=2836649 RepID=UPI001FBBC9D1|nr:HD domain-containing phosphohydrolase [Methylobacterium sp. J-068]MCJ2036211.1 response regulator [Methylobacterium sp. J-068]
MSTHPGPVRSTTLAHPVVMRAETIGRVLPAMRALVIDDSRANLGHLQALIRSVSDVTCHGFTDPVAAIAAAGETAFDIVVVDYLMPIMDGLDVIRHLRRQPTHASIPIVMVTGRVNEAVKLAAIEAGATDFLSKSVGQTELKARLRNLIQLSASLRWVNDQAAWLEHALSVATHELLEREEEMILRLSRAVEYRDNDTGGHTLRVAAYSRIIAEELGLPPDTCRSIYLAAPLHDVGKVAIPDAILLKPGRLDPEEFIRIQGHAALGHEILAGSRSGLIQLAAEIAGAHHERWDGSGYPAGLRGRLIPLAARIVAVADVFDALTTVRPYKAAQSFDEALAHIESERGKHFDPTCVQAFLAGRRRILEAKHAYADR